MFISLYVIITCAYRHLFMTVNQTTSNRPKYLRDPHTSRSLIYRHLVNSSFFMHAPSPGRQSNSVLARRRTWRKSRHVRARRRLIERFYERRLRLLLALVKVSYRKKPKVDWQRSCALYTFFLLFVRGTFTD